eukprot:CAMPEP_0184494500 /NCGR_PEP_ID=MMETSP0113_2-20130426/28867_1 /TAXON_ID=91329 /ORGANISM="Norrisiella sphaerica, Strain BC52" /LENGTH=1046 /DNA_ID=CAMNT_0026880273 /DNA_START=257 /DNA_END=3397 /DNA_ORIENTATION=-
MEADDEEAQMLSPCDMAPLPENIETGLSDAMAKDLLAEHGPNEIDATNGWLDDLVQGLFRLICNPLIGLLAALGALSFLTGDYSTGTVISVMALVSICLSAYHQFSAEKAARALSAGFGTTCRVARGPSGRHIVTVESKSVVPGDVVLISAGDLIPADLQMISASRLQVNQSILTGESVPVEKVANPDAYSPSNAIKPNTGCCAVNARCSARFRSGVLEGIRELSDDEICFMGTHVESGSATGRVIATGERTRVGQMAESLKGLRPKSSFDKGVDGFGGLMMQFTLIMCPLVFLIQTLKDGLSSEGFLYAVSVGVGLTPEMLPVVVTVCLALGAMRLSRSKGVIVKHLDSLPTLGQLDVLCVDKTGTLTRDAAQVELSLTIEGKPNANVLKLAHLHSLHQTGIQNAVEKAILEAGSDSKEAPTKACSNVLRILRPDTKLKVTQEWPFDFDRRRSSILISEEAADGTDSIFIMKGAPSEVMSVCSVYLDSNTSMDAKAATGHAIHSPIASKMGGVGLPLDQQAMRKASSTLVEWEKQGLRPIAVAAAVGEADVLARSGEQSEGICLLGFLFLADPPKASAAATISILRSQGVAVKVLTGDSPEVSRHVAERVGLIAPSTPVSLNGSNDMGDNTNDFNATRVSERKGFVTHSTGLVRHRAFDSDNVVLTGKELGVMSDKKLTAAVKKGVIFARLQPMHKERIVKCLQTAGFVVGFLGDGVNDCAALRAADVGVSVESGLDVAKAAADVVLVDKSLLALEECVRSGRFVFANVIKYIKMAASSNWGNMFSVIGASLFLPFVPMLPLQVVAGNLIYDFAQLSIPTDNVPAWHLTSPLRWDIGAIAKFVLLLGPVSSIFDFITFYLAYWHLGGRDDPAVFRTAWFIEGILSQLFIVFVLRTAVPESAPGHVVPLPPASALTPSSVRSHGSASLLLSPRNHGLLGRCCGMQWDASSGPSWTLIIVTVTMGVLAVLFTQIPVIGNELDFVRMPPQYWPWLVLILVAYCVLTAGLMHTVLPHLLKFRRKKERRRPKRGESGSKDVIKVVTDKMS